MNNIRDDLKILKDAIAHNCIIRADLVRILRLIAWAEQRLAGDADDEAQANYNLLLAENTQLMKDRSYWHKEAMKLREENERLREANVHLHHQTNKLGEQILILRNELADAKHDAERYRWLRAHESIMLYSRQKWVTSHRLDQVVDAEMTN